MHIILYRGKKYEQNCNKSDVVMDDVLPGVIIDGVLGVNLTSIDDFKSQLDDVVSGNSRDVKNATQVVYMGYSLSLPYSII